MSEKEARIEVQGKVEEASGGMCRVKLDQGSTVLAYASGIQVRGMRTCGECRACCMAFDVGALNKPAGAACPHLQAESGCGIYPDRPDACRAFACGWLRDTTWTDDERPDRLGLIVVPEDQDSAFASAAAVPLLVAYELRPGAHESCDAEPLLKRLSRHRLVALVRHGWESREREPSGFIGQSELP